jgi:small subunit ribosomal protein S4e
MLGLVKNRKEARRLLSERHVKVDGVVRRNDNYPVGLMDVFEIPVTKQIFRILLKRRHGLSLHSISEDEKEFKLCKITNKSTVRGGNVQLNLHDGRNLLLKINDPMNPLEDEYKTHDVLKLEIPSSEILDHLPFSVGVFAVVEKGKNVGRWGKVIAIEKEVSLRPSIVTFKDFEDNEFKTILDYVFPIGKDQPWISMPKEVE